MENKPIKMIVGIIVVILIVVAVVIGIQMANKASEGNQISKSDNQNEIKDYFILYEGKELDKKVGFQRPDFISLTDENSNKYNIKYYNFEKGKYVGETEGKLNEPAEGFGTVEGVKKIAISKYYNAIPRNFERINTLPEELNSMADYSSVNIDSIDLDNDGKNENIVCWTINYKKGEKGNTEPKASSGIVLYDSNYNKIANLVNLENGFWANIKSEDNKVFLSLDENIDYIDVDNDGIMEIIIKIPFYARYGLSIVKYNKGNIDGEINYEASVLS